MEEGVVVSVIAGVSDARSTNATHSICLLSKLLCGMGAGLACIDWVDAPV